MTLLQQVVQPPSKSAARLSTAGIGHFKCPDIRSPEQLLSKAVVIKITGKICDSENLANLARDVKSLTERGMKVILIHGGGRQIDAALAAASITTVKKDGIRVTPKEAMPIIASVMSDVNSQVGAAIRAAGNSTVCIDNVKCPIINASRKDGYGEVGEVASVDVKAINLVLRRSDVLVLSCLGASGETPLNVNADDVAYAVAKSLKVQKLIVLSDVPGVLNGQTLIDSINPTTASALLRNGTITGGMVVKVNALLDAASHVQEVILASGNTNSVLDILDGTNSTCTRFSNPASVN